MVQFMIVDIKLIPNVLSLMDRDKEHIALIACYKIWPCKMFRERIFMTSRVTSLQARNDTQETFVEELACSQASANKRNELLQNENSRLKEEIAMLLALSAVKLTSSSKKTIMAEEVKESIGERVKNRNTRRIRGRSAKSSNGNIRRSNSGAENQNHSTEHLCIHQSSKLGQPNQPILQALDGSQCYG